MNWLFLFLALLSTRCFSSEKKYDLAICAVFQNEEFFLKEWLEFHKLIGVQHFYLYNNLSDDHSLSILKPYVEKGEVDLIDWPVEVRTVREYLDLLQLPVYHHALTQFKEEACWIAFIDIDEFLFPVQDENLVAFLRHYEDYAALAVNWQVFGTSGLAVLPSQKLIIESLIYKGSEDRDINKTVKLIVQPQRVRRVETPHLFIYEDGCFAVDSNSRQMPLQAEKKPVLIDKVRINHYWFGTSDWLLHNKIPRREKWGIVIKPSILENIIDFFNEVQDETIVRFVPELRRRMESS